MSRARHAIVSAVVSLAVAAVGQALAASGHTPVEQLTPEEASRTAENWTLQQILEKGWTPYDCFFGATPLAPTGRRWAMNDAAPPALGTCVSYSFMADGLALEVWPPPEGPTTFNAGMPAGSAMAVTAAAGTWAAAADIHFTLVNDGGAAFNAGGPGQRGNIRVARGTIPQAGVLAHAYLPPPGPGVSSFGDLHFDDGFAYVTAGAAPGPPFDVQTVALHELGHSLGLDHAGTVPADIMFPTYTGVKQALAPGDVGFITMIYGASGHAAACVAACCFSATVCGMRTEADCMLQGGQWRGPGTQCPTQGVFPVMHSSGPVVHITNPAVNCFNIVLSPEGPSESECLPDATNCCTAHGGPGCEDPECEAAVCAVDSFCCNVAWDSICAGQAEKLCNCGLTGEIDPWTSPMDPDQPTCHVFGAGPESPPIPADFFSPGSLPFTGRVCLHGEPLGDTPYGNYDLADTLVRRSADPFDRCALPSPLERTVDIELVALSLRSIQPIVVQGPQPTLWDVQVHLSPTPAPPGQITATKSHCNGGTYSSVLFVQPLFTFTNVENGDVRVLDTGAEDIPPIQLQQPQHTWSDRVDPWLDLAGGVCTDFHPGIMDPNQSTSCDCQGNGVRDDCDIEQNTSGDCNANGTPDECDPDVDGDGVPDGCDNCPDHPNPGQAPLCTQTPGEVDTLLVTSYDETTGDLGISYTTACATIDNTIVFGSLQDVSTYGYSGQDCGIGNSGSYSAFNPGPDSYFFLVVANDGGTSEGSYGLNSNGVERPEDLGDPVCPLTQALTLRCD